MLTTETIAIQGGLYPFSVLKIKSSNLLTIEKELKIKKNLAPLFFNNTPMFIKIEDNNINLSLIHI